MYLCHVIEQDIPIKISNDLHQNFYRHQNFDTHQLTSYPTQIHHTFLKKNINLKKKIILVPKKIL